MQPENNNENAPQNMNDSHQTQTTAAPQRRGKKRWGLRFSFAFAALAVLLALACVWLWKQNSYHKYQVDHLITHLQAAQTALRHRDTDLRAITKVISAPDTVQVTLIHQQGTPPGEARLMYNARMGIVVYSGEIAPAPEKKSYQLWLVPSSGAPVSAGVVKANQDAGATVAHVPQNLSAKAFMVTLEPEGGQSQPNEAKVLVGAVGTP